MLFLVVAIGSATTVTMDLTGFGPGVDGGPNTSAGVYTYPYYFSITSGSTTSTNVGLVCDSYDNEVWQYETWTANQISLTSVIAGSANGLYGPATLYEDAAWLYAQMGTHPTSANAAKYNWAIWGLFSATAKSQSAYTSSGASSIVLPANFTGFDFSGYSIYVPINPPDGTLNGNHVNDLPQEYIGYSPTITGHGPPPRTPEPGTMMLVGVGMLGVFRKIRTKR